MATLALAVAGAAVGNALLPAGVTVLGATLTGAAIGAQVGALGGSFIDNALFGASGRSRALEGPRLTELRVTGSSEGAPIPRLYGRTRLGGQLIWATDFEEEVVTTKQGGGGKGGALGPQSKSRRVSLLRQLRRRALRGRDRRHRPGLGRRHRARPLHPHPPPLHRQRDARPRQPDRGPRGRRQRAGLPRHRLRRVRAPGARALRQPHPAALLRGRPRRRSVHRRASAP